MSYIKNSIPDDYNCSHFDNIDNCVECQYSMQTAHIKSDYRPRIEKWYNKKSRSKKWVIKM